MFTFLRHGARRLWKAFRNLPGIFRGYNLYVDRDKLNLIEFTFEDLLPDAKSFADLGGVWNVNGAYALYACDRYPIEEGFLVDVRFNSDTNRKIARRKNIVRIKGNFSSAETAERIASADVIFLFDVLLHQSKPDWEEVLKLYSSRTRCFLIYNQQFTGSETSVKLTDLPLTEYKALTPSHRHELYEDVYSRRDEWNEEYNKKWIDIPDIFQWAITDRDLRAVMKSLGFQEVYFKNCGRFSNLDHFENHAFVFLRR